MWLLGIKIDEIIIYQLRTLYVKVYIWNLKTVSMKYVSAVFKKFLSWHFDEDSNSQFWFN